MAGALLQVVFLFFCCCSALFFFCFRTCSLFQDVRHALRLQDTPNKLLRGSGTHFLRIFSVFFQTTGGVDKLLHVAVADVLKTGYGRLLRIATRHMYVAFFRINIVIRTRFLLREFTKGGVRGVSPRNINQAYTFPRLAKRDAYRALARAALLASIAYPSGERSEPDIFLMLGSLLTMLESISYHTGEHKLAPPLAVASGGKRTKSCMLRFTGGSRSDPPGGRICAQFGVVLGWAKSGRCCTTILKICINDEINFLVF